MTIPLIMSILQNCPLSILHCNSFLSSEDLLTSELIYFSTETLSAPLLFPPEFYWIQVNVQFILTFTLDSPVVGSLSLFLRPSRFSSHHGTLCVPARSWVARFLGCIFDYATYFAPQYLDPFKRVWFLAINFRRMNRVSNRIILRSDIKMSFVTLQLHNLFANLCLTTVISITSCRMRLTRFINLYL